MSADTAPMEKMTVSKVELSGAPQDQQFNTRELAFLNDAMAFFNDKGLSAKQTEVAQATQGTDRMASQEVLGDFTAAAVAGKGGKNQSASLA